MAHNPSLRPLSSPFLHLGILPLLLTVLTQLATTSLNAAEPPDTNYDETKVPAYTLPDLLKLSNGSHVTTAADWTQQRRPEILQILEDHLFGATPRTMPFQITAQERESDTSALAGTATRKQIRLHIDKERQLAIDLLIYLPNAHPQPVPAFVGLNFYGNQTIHSDPAIHINPRWMRGNSQIGIKNNHATEATRGVYQARWQAEKLIARGYALVTAYCGDIDPDNYRHDYTDGVHPLFYSPGQTRPTDSAWGTVGTWAWGLSRIVDYLTENESLVDAQRLAVIGHSRLGKTSLWAGAQDERFALVVSNNSGCGGAALYRREFGERIHHMIKPVGYWFSLNHARYAHHEQTLPFDQHMLLALVAPRPLYVASATEDLWADPKGEFLAALATNPVYHLFDRPGLPATQQPPADAPVTGTVGYHLRSGQHDVTAYDWDQYLRFADGHFKSKN